MDSLILPFEGASPRIAADAFIAPGAVIVGDVEIGPGASVWYNCVLRGDVNRIIVGRGSNIQDGTVIHVSARHPVIVGEDVLVGHLCMLHGCTLRDRSFVGMRATILDGATVESDAMIAAGALLAPGKTATAGKLWAGSPATPMRDLGPDEIARFRWATEHYAENARLHREALAGA